MNQKNKNSIFSSEDALIEFLKQKIPRFGATLGVGDDAAIISISGKQLVLTTDSIVENVHFKREWITPRFLGKKAARVNLSDIAAMGAIPMYALISLVLPKEYFRKPFISELYKGFSWAFIPHNVEIIGGNVSSGREINITLTIIGECQAKPLTRNGARVGDAIFCTGLLGKAAGEVSLLLSGKKKQMEIVPPDRIAFARDLAQRNLATACIDISDGLVLDLGRICKSSNVGATLLENTLPIDKRAKNWRKALEYALSGEDYELLFTAFYDRKEDIILLSQKNNIYVTEIGEIVEAGKGLHTISKSGKLIKLYKSGWDHLAKL